MNNAQLANALRQLVQATYHMTDTSTLTDRAFPNAHAAAREALAAYDASEEGLRARARDYAVSVSNRIEALACEIAESDFSPDNTFTSTVMQLRSAADTLEPLIGDL